VSYDQDMKRIHKRLGYLDCCMKINRFTKSKINYGFWGFFGLIKWNELMAFEISLISSDYPNEDDDKTG